jgi:retron-type reverse transcriptase
VAEGEPGEGGHAVTRYGDLWGSVVDWSNLVLAAKKARRGKRDREAVQKFDFHLERNLLGLQRELASGAYRPGPFTTHWIHVPKSRLISAAPYRDRVVHHAVMNVLEPILDRHFHPDSFACRKGKGTHAAARRLQHLMRRYPFALQCDVRKFFPSIDHEVLKETFRRRLKDRRVLALLDVIVDSSNEQEAVIEHFPGDSLFTPLDHRRGLPIGNLTSQWFANWYLDRFDHTATNVWRVGHVRYCDDFVMLGYDRGRLKELLPVMAAELGRVRLKLHSKRATVGPTRAGRSFVGYRISPPARRLTNSAVRRCWRRFGWQRRALAGGEIDREAVHRSLMGWMGHVQQGDGLGLVRRVVERCVFRRGQFVRFRACARRSRVRIAAVQ